MMEFLVHDEGVWAASLDQVYQHKLYHDPRGLDSARRLAEPGDRIRLGLFYKNEEVPRYDDLRRLPARTSDERVAFVSEELDRFSI